MKKELYTRLFGLAVLMLLPSCVKDTIYNTPHPDKGALVIHLPEELVGESHVVKINERSYELVSVPFVCPDMLPAGNHTIILHNRADGFVFDGFVARIGDVTNKSRANRAPMNPVPDYLRPSVRRSPLSPTTRCVSHPFPFSVYGTCISSWR